MLKSFVAVGVAVLIGSAAVRTQDPGCLHGTPESTEQAYRRRAALQFVRQINTTEASTYAERGRYGALAELPGGSATPAGFQAQLSTDGATYMVSVKDTMDACHFAFFSDQSGLIYTAMPIR